MAETRKVSRELRGIHFHRFLENQSFSALSQVTVSPDLPFLSTVHQPHVSSVTSLALLVRPGSVALMLADLNPNDGIGQWRCPIRPQEEL